MSTVDEILPAPPGAGTPDSRLFSELTDALRRVGRGDLTVRLAHRPGPAGEVVDCLNATVEALAGTARVSAEQSRLDAGLARIARLLHEQRDPGGAGQLILDQVAPLVGAHLGAFFLADADAEADADADTDTDTDTDTAPDPGADAAAYPDADGDTADGTIVDTARPAGPATAGGPGLRLAASYGYPAPQTAVGFGLGEGLVGQAVQSGRLIRISAPPSSRLVLRSGLLATPPVDLVVVPVVNSGQPIGAIELASVVSFSDQQLAFLQRLANSVATTLTTMVARARAHQELARARQLVRGLEERAAQLQRGNAELRQNVALLSDRNTSAEIQQRELALTRYGLEKKAQRIARASEYQSEFLASMSHELRTPLNSMLLLSRLLADDLDRELTPKQVEFAETIQTAGLELLALIDDIMDLSRIEAGRVDVDAADVPLAEVVEQLEHDFAVPAAEKGLHWEVTVDARLPATLYTDSRRLRQILRNLTSNAVKFTNTGSVSVSIEPAAPDRAYGLVSLDSARQVVSFAVTDTGTGIPEEYLGLIFEAFQRGDTPGPAKSGSGLGLSISRRLARLLGGTIEVRSELGEGSAFVLYLPDEVPRSGVVRLATASADVDLGPAGVDLGPAGVDLGPAGVDAVPAGDAALLPLPVRPGPPMLAPDTPPQRRTSVAAHELDGATVLIIDDDVRNVFALTSALELHGMTVLYADNGTDGVCLLSEHPEVDIVLMDVMLPDLDGNETTRMIRRNWHFADLPVVFLTARALPGDRESGLAAGASDYLTKPVDLDELLEVMASWADVRGQAV